MAVLHVTKVPSDTIAEGKARAAQARVTFREWVIGALEARLSGVVAPIPGPTWIGKSLTNTPTVPEDTTRIIAEAQARLEERKKADPLGQMEKAFERTHDPGVCRLYGCGRCRALGIKSSERGL